MGKPQLREKMGLVLVSWVKPNLGVEWLPTLWAENLEEEGEKCAELMPTCCAAAPKKNISDKSTESRQWDWRRDSLGSADKADGLF